MIEPVKPLDEAQLRHEFRDFVKDKGIDIAYQAMYEMLFATNVLIEVIIEESENNEHGKDNKPS